MKRNRQERQKKQKSLRWQALLIPLMIGILAVFLCARETKDSSPQFPLKFVTAANDSELTYVLHIYPHSKSERLFKWTATVKELSTGKIVLRQAAQTMRGQENELLRRYHPDGSHIKITFRIHKKQPKLLYTIKRTRGDQVVYRCEGETKLEDNKKN
jgi:hypothetical protein